jgi:hypothetical protein
MLRSAGARRRRRGGLPGARLRLAAPHPWFSHKSGSDSPTPRLFFRSERRARGPIWPAALPSAGWQQPQQGDLRLSISGQCARVGLFNSPGCLLRQAACVWAHRSTGPAASPSAGWLPSATGGRRGDVSPLALALCVLVAQHSRPIVTIPAGINRSQRMKPLHQTHYGPASLASKGPTIGIVLTRC